MTFDLNNKPFDLKQTIQRSFETMDFLAVEKKINLVLKVDDKLSPFLSNLVGDEGRYTQILLNFLSNALKFSFEDGQISVSLVPSEENFY